MMQNKSEKPLIEVKHVRKIYRMGDEKVVALDDVSLDIFKGEIVCFLGTSGSGKSTFLNMVAGLEKPTRGEIIIGGVPIHKLNEENVTLFRQKNIGFIFQAYHLMPMMTALENVSLPLIFRGMAKKKREQISRQTMASVGLKGYEKRKPSQMSGGQQQRVGIARALVGTPKIIFADEPTGNLDTNTTKEVMNLIVKQVKKHGQTLIIVTHDRTIAAYADKVVTIQDGNILHVKENEHPAVCVEEPEPIEKKEKTDKAHKADTVAKADKISETGKTGQITEPAQKDKADKADKVDETGAVEAAKNETQKEKEGSKLSHFLRAGKKGKKENQSAVRKEKQGGESKEEQKAKDRQEQKGKKEAETKVENVAGAAVEEGLK